MKTKRISVEEVLALLAFLVSVLLAVIGQTVAAIYFMAMAIYLEVSK